MDEAHTLRYLGWTVGGIVGCFVSSSSDGPDRWASALMISEPSAELSCWGETC